VTQLNVEWEWCSLTCGTLGGPEYWAVPIQIPLTLLSEAYVALMKSWIELCYAPPRTIAIY